MSDRFEGTARQMGGRVQSAVGDAVGDAKTQAQGAYNQAAGQVQNAAGQLTDAVRDQPIVAVLAALAVGYVLGRLTA